MRDMSFLSHFAICYPATLLPATSNLKRKLPIPMTSPSVRGVGFESGNSLSIVPYRLPKSSSHHTPSAWLKQACWAEAKASYKTMVFWASRPKIVTGCSGKVSPTAHFSFPFDAITRS